MQSERARQKRLERKRRRREAKRRLVRGERSALLELPALPEEVAELTSWPLMSETLTEFARPLLDDLPEDAGPEGAEAALMLASIVWNVLNGAGEEAPGWGSVSSPVRLVAQLADELGLAVSEAAELVRALERRKRALFPDDPRIVLGVRAYGRAPDGELRVEAMSTILR